MFNSNLKVKYHGKITYTMGENHPYIKYIENYSKDKIFTFEDTYIFDLDKGFWDDEDERIVYIKNDLALVAGGGYNTENIYNMGFEINRV